MAAPVNPGTWLDKSLLINIVSADNTPLPVRSEVRLVTGITATDNPTNDTTDLFVAAGATDYTPTLDGTSATVVPGDSIGSANQSSNANVARTQTSTRAQAPKPIGLVLLGAGAGGVPMVQTTGSVAKAVTGLGSGVVSHVAVSPSTGKLVRILLPDGSEAGMGVTDAQGNVTISPSGYVGTAPHHVINVRQAPYLAVGDGVADDTAAINAALAACAAAGGGIVLIPPGTYKTTYPLVLGVGTTLKGQSKFVSIINIAHTGDGIQNLNPCDAGTRVHSTVENLTINGIGGSSIGALVRGLDSTYFHVKHNIFTASKFGVIFDQCSISTIEKNEFANVTYNVWLTNGSDSLNAAFQSSHAYVVGELLIPTTPNHRLYVVTVAGTSASEPSWTTTVGNTNTSGGVTFKCFATSINATPGYPGFTNSIEVSGNQFNTGTVGIIDDGGVAHEIRRNNYENFAIGLFAGGIQGGTVSHEEAEAISSYWCRVDYLSYFQHQAAGVASGLIFMSNEIAPGAKPGIYCVDYGNIVLIGNVFSCTGVAAVQGVANGSQMVDGGGNVNSGAAGTMWDSSATRSLMHGQDGQTGYGINAVPLGAGLFINADLATQMHGLTLVNGANGTIARTGYTNLEIAGPTGAYSIQGIDGGFDGCEVYLFNTQPYALTLTHQNADTTAANRIYSLTGSDVVLASRTSYAHLRYSRTLTSWVVVGTA